MTVIIFIGRIFSLPFLFFKYLARRTYRDESGKVVKLDNPARLRLALEDLGGVFVKFGQVLAMHFDLLPIRYGKELLNLRNNAEPLPSAEMFNIFESETERGVKEVFESIDENPLITTFFAQIHKATYQGKDVVVKIQKPYVRKYIRADLAVLWVLSFFIDNIGFLKAVSMKEIIRQLKEWMSNQLDYTFEAHANQIIYDHAKTHSLLNIVIPYVYTELTTKKILVKEFVSGSQVKRIISYLATRPGDVEKILEERNINLLEASNLFIRDIMRQYFIDGIFHIDTYPSNLFIFPESHVGYINFSVAARPSYSSVGFLKFIKAASELNFYEASEGITDFTHKQFLTETGDLLDADPKVNTVYEKLREFITKNLAEDLAPIIEKWHSADTNASVKQSSTAVFAAIIKTAREYKINFPPDAITFLRSLLMIETACLKLSRDFNIIKAIKTFFEHYSLDDVKEKETEHGEEIADVHEFTGLHLTGIAPEKEGEKTARLEEKRYIAKEKFMAKAAALAEKYQELYNEIK